MCKKLIYLTTFVLAVSPVCFVTYIIAKTEEIARK